MQPPNLQRRRSWKLTFDPSAATAGSVSRRWALIVCSAFVQIIAGAVCARTQNKPEEN